MPDFLKVEVKVVYPTLFAHFLMLAVKQHVDDEDEYTNISRAEMRIG